MVLSSWNQPQLSVTDPDQCVVCIVLRKFPPRAFEAGTEVESEQHALFVTPNMNRQNEPPINLSAKINAEKVESQHTFDVWVSINN